ncbi:hypothetical protein [Bradyrhizobium sp. RDT46]|uniref:hypothetical protein n=1 Tax=Bradyrhizobium sp. RDT46 TaxID=3341829 RepID=UPI0035C68033
MLNVSLKFFEEKPATAHDEALMRELRMLFTISVVEWLKTDNFYGRWLFARVDSITEVADGWTTAHKEFGDKKLNRRLDLLKRLCREFSTQEDYAFSEGSNLQFRTFRNNADRNGLTVETTRKADNLRTTAQALAAAFEDIEREAKKRLPDA